MKKIKVLALCAIVAGVVTSCQKDEISSTETQLESSEVTKTELEKLLDMGVNTSDVTTKMIQHPGEAAAEYIVAGDLTFKRDDFGIYPTLEDTDNGNKQYRTSNLVSSGNYNISVIGYTGSCCALTTKMRTGLQYAIDNYNAISSMNLNFTLTFAASTSADIVVYNNGASGGGGSAGFPSGGQPNKYIQINQGTDAYSTNVLEHVITHEIGHSVGFRHQDWQTRQSCGQNTNEGTAGVGAILISGTPSSGYADSIMLACFGSGEDGEFSSSDITALQTLY